MKKGSPGSLGLTSCLIVLLATRNANPCGNGSGSLSITAVPGLGGSALQVNGLNATGQLAGFAYTTNDLAAHAFLFSSGVLTDFGTFGGSISVAYGLNNSGLVVGSADLGDGVSTHAFRWDTNGLVDLGTLGGSYSAASAVNNAGLIVGSSLISGDAEVDAFLYSNGLMTNIGSLGGGGSSAVAINDQGHVAGDSFTTNFENHAYLYSNGTMTDLGTLGGDYSSASALNSADVVVGESSDTNMDTHAFFYSGGAMVDLGTLGGTFSSAVAVNENNQVVGMANISGDTQTHGFIYSGGPLIDVGTLGGTYSSAQAINNLGQVVGYAGIADNTSHAFVWQNGTMTDLNSLLPTNSAWVLASANFINDSGRIVGSGTFNGLGQSFVLDLAVANNPPVANPGTNQTVDCQSLVILDGSHSTDPDADILTFQWNEGSQILSTAAVFQASFPLGTHTFTLTVTDPCGAISQSNVVVQVTDTTPPVFVSLPAALTLSVGANCLAALPDLTSAVVATDNCTPSNHLTITQSPLAGTMLGLGTQIVTFTATDASGNAVSSGVTLNVVDVTAPVITSAPSTLTLSVGANCQATVPDLSSAVVATDNCTPANQLAISQSPTATTSLGLGQHTVTITVTDLSGNTSTTNVPVTVVDTTAPVIVSAPGSLTLSVGANCQAIVPDLSSAVVATDNCTPANQLVISQSPAATTSLGLGQHSVTISVTDASGNSSTTNISVTVLDTTAPAIVSAPGSLTLSVGANCQATVPDLSSGVVATDNCTPASQLVISQSPAASASFGLGQHTVTLSVTDASGNTATTNVSVTVVDTTAPVILSAPGSLTLSVGSNCQALVPDLSSSVVATDNCTPANQLVISQSPAATTSLGLGQHSVTISVTDASGNTSTTNVSVTVVDTTAPVIVSSPGPLTVSVGANCQAAVPNVLANVSATDNCTPANQLVMTQSPAAGTLLGPGQYTITISVTDASGNTATTSVLLTVADLTPPSIQSISANPSVLSPPNHQIVPVTVTVVASDNCDPSPVSRITSVTCNETLAPGDVQITGPLTVNLAATRNPSGSGRIYVITVQCTDASGNFSTGTVNVCVAKKTK